MMSDFGQGIWAGGNTGGHLAVAPGAEGDHVALHVIPLADGAMDLRPHAVVAANLAGLLGHPDPRTGVNTASFAGGSNSVTLVMECAQTFRRVRRLTARHRTVFLFRDLDAPTGVALPAVDGLRAPFHRLPTVNTGGGSPDPTGFTDGVPGAGVSAHRLPALHAGPQRLSASCLPALDALHPCGVLGEALATGRTKLWFDPPAAFAHLRCFAVGCDECSAFPALGHARCSHPSHVSTSLSRGVYHTSAVMSTSE